MSTLGDAADDKFGKSQDTECFLIFCPRHVSSRLPLAVKPANTPRLLVHKKTWRDSLPIDMLLSAVSFLVVVQPSLEFPEGLMNYPVHQIATKLVPGELRDELKDNRISTCQILARVLKDTQNSF